MLQLLTQYQNYIYTTFIVVEVLRYLYGAYTSWQANRTRLRRINAGIELYMEAYLTMVQVMIFKKFRPLSNKARIAFNTVLQPNTKCSKSMWALINRVIESYLNHAGWLSESEPVRPVTTEVRDGNNMKYHYSPTRSTLHRFMNNRRQNLFRRGPVQEPMLWEFEQQPQQPATEYEGLWTLNAGGLRMTNVQFNEEPLNNDNNAETQPTQQQMPVESESQQQPQQQSQSEDATKVTEPTPVTEHPLQQTPEKSIYEGMELAASRDDVNNQPTDVEPLKRPRFVIASTDSLNMSK